MGYMSWNSGSRGTESPALSGFKQTRNVLAQMTEEVQEELVSDGFVEGPTSAFS